MSVIKGKMVQIFSHGDDSGYFHMVRETVTDEWISQQFKTLYKKNQFKEQGVLLGLVHPLIADYINIQISIRKATILKQKRKILTGIGYHRIMELGRTLCELKDICNIDKIKNRLRSASQYYDVCWELDVALVLKYSGFNVTFIEEGSAKSYDLLATKNGLKLAIECKNKKANHQNREKINSICTAISRDVLRQMDKQTSRCNIRITLLSVETLAEAKHIRSKTMKLLDQGLCEIRTDKFIIELIPKYETLPTNLIMKRYGEEAAFCSAKCEIQEAYNKEPITERNYNNRVFFRFTPPEERDASVVGLLEKANRQFKENDTVGCVFLRVPYGFLEEACEEVNRLLQRTYTSIGAVKIVGIKNTFSSTHGVITGRKEQLIVNARCISPLDPELIQELSKNIMFNIYNAVP